MLCQKKSLMKSHKQKREAVPKHSLPPQEQILSYMGRFINCPYGTPEKSPGCFYVQRNFNRFFLGSRPDQ